MCAAFEDSHKKVLLASGVFPGVAQAVLHFPANEDIATFASVFFYFMIEELMRALSTRKLSFSVIDDVSGGSGVTGGVPKFWTH